MPALPFNWPDSTSVHGFSALAFVEDVSDVVIEDRTSNMTKRKLMLFFVIAVAVFAASQGEHVKRADASSQSVPTTQPAPATLQR